mgnify:CR=1 FL=1
MSSTPTLFGNALRAIKDTNYIQADELLQKCIDNNDHTSSRIASILFYKGIEEWKERVGNLSSDEIKWIKKLAEKETKKRSVEEKVTVAEFNNQFKDYDDEIALRKEVVEEVKEIEN